MNKTFSVSRREGGSVLLEGLIALLLFSVGILAIVGMQGTAVRASSDAKYRSDASMLVNQLIGQMWASDRTPAVLQASFQGGAGTNGTAYTAWLNQVQATLPGTGANLPQVAINVAPGALPTSVATSQVSITLWWQAPSDPTGAAPHQYSVVTQIGG